MAGHPMEDPNKFKIKMKQTEEEDGQINENNLPVNTGNISRTPGFKNTNRNPSSKEVADKNNGNFYND